MQTIKIFLGSSIDELREERLFLSDYLLNSVRPIFKRDGVDIEVVKCEDIRTGYKGKSSQEEINDLLRECDISIFIFKTKAGDQTVREYNVAQELVETKKHEIYVYCFGVSEEEKEKSLKSFKRKMRKIELYWKTCKDVNDLEKQFVIGLLDYERQLLGKAKPSAFEQESEAEQDGDARFAKYQQNEQAQIQLRKEIHKDIEDLLQQTETVMANEDETIAARIFKVIELYKKADRWAAATDYDNKKYSDLLFDYAQFLNKYGLYKDAVEVYLRQIAITEELCGKEDEKSATSYNEIGIVYYNKGDYSKALEYYFKALTTREKILGAEHPDTANTNDNIGAVYRKQGVYDKALKFMFKALEIREKVFNTEHCDNAFSYNNIAGIYWDLGDYNNALKYQHKALDIFEKVLGTENLEIATIYNNIGASLNALNDFDNALKYHLKALKIREKVLGAEHPDTANSYNNIGIVYWKQFDYDNALKYYLKALIIREQSLGTKHPDTARIYNNIGLVYAMKKNYDKALMYYFKALRIWEEVLNKEHPDIATSYHNIGTVYCLQENYVNALKYLSEAYLLRQKILGPEHPDTKVTLNWIEDVNKATKSIPNKH